MSGHGKEGTRAGVGDCWIHCPECNKLTKHVKSVCVDCGNFRVAQ